MPNYLNKILELFKTYGYPKIFFTFILCTIMFLIGAITWKVATGDVIDRTLESIIENQQALDKHRMEINPKVISLLDKTRVDTDASRVLIFEYHNGTKSLIGIPFLYADMTYESYHPSIIPYVDEFSSLNTSKFPIFNYIACNDYWDGTIEELKAIDRRFAMRLESENVEYVFIKVLPLDGCGCTVLTYENKIDFSQPEREKIKYLQTRLGYELEYYFSSAYSTSK